jgi:NHL repeat-containing protein
MRFSRGFALAAVGATALAGAALTARPALASPHTPPTFLGHLHFTKKIASTVPGNGDVNPYGVAVVGRSQGRLRRGNILVSNFNNSANQQGTGSTIVQITPGGHVGLFAQISSRGLPGLCPGGIGLSTALVIIHGWVIVGSTPSQNGDPATAQAGCLLVLDNRGRVRETFFGHGINGPWDATAVTQGQNASLFVTNVLNGTVSAGGNVVNKGTVLRIALRFFTDPGHLPQMTGFTIVGSNFAEKTDPDAFVVGPTGVGIGRGGQLYVADTVNNRIQVIQKALTRPTSSGVGTTVTSDGFLNAPLGLTIAPNGNILTVNGGDGRIVETTPLGHQVATKFLDTSGSPPGAGALFGIALTPDSRNLYYVDDAANTLRLLF